MKAQSILKTIEANKSLVLIGDVSFRGRCASEAVEQVTFFAKLRREFPKYAAIAIHARNEGKRHYAQTMKAKSEGMVTGASDIIIPCAVPFVCELKRRDVTASKITEKQVNYLLSAQELGAFSCVALGFDAAYQAFKLHVLK